MVIRNYAPFLGVCNGTRVMVREMGRRLLKVLILTGPKHGNTSYLPRICCDSAEDTDLPVALRRYQFPARLAWAMTITSCQSREFDGVVAVWDLGSRHFTLAHLYVAATRVKHGSKLVVVPPERRRV